VDFRNACSELRGFACSKTVSSTSTLEIVRAYTAPTQKQRCFIRVCLHPVANRGANCRIQCRIEKTGVKVTRFNAEWKKQHCKWQDSTQNRTNSVANGKIQCRIEKTGVKVTRFNAESKKQDCKSQDLMQNRRKQD
jgi:hypothetical protein